MTEKHILVVDDEFGIVEVLTGALGDHGYHVVPAYNGEQALARIADQRPALAVVDYMMPVSGGRHLLEVLSSGECADIPVILISSADESAVRGSGAKYRVFLRKPFRLVAILEAVEALIGKPG